VEPAGLHNGFYAKVWKEPHPHAGSRKSRYVSGGSEGAARHLPAWSWVRGEPLGAVVEAGDEEATKGKKAQ